jgi:peptidoglycan/xylan/chitin deacetylase (PgdA/CDA1 family)
MAIPASRLLVSVVACVTAAVVALPAAAKREATRDTAVAILMYHVIAKPPATAPYPALYVSQPEFASQMTWLARHGYEAVTLDRVYASWHGQRRLPRRPIVLTFDDGSASISRNALPMLRKVHWRGVLNLKLGNVRSHGGITPAQVRRLARAGWEIDSHTISHPDLTTLSPAALRHEVADSRWMIQRRFKAPARFFCYPAGRYDARVIAAVRAAGYLGATTTRSGLARSTEPFELARVRIDGEDGVAGLRRKLEMLGG